MAKAIMVQGTMSNAGKSYLAAALCRIFHQDGYRVAPFKSQNMALNSFITEEGLEMGRAQVMQAEAAGIKPSVLMNPILLKPTNDTGSQVIVNGEVLGNLSAKEYYRRKREMIPHIMQAYRQLDEQYDIIVLEGAGSPAEINLKQDDIVNMGMAKLAKAPVLLVGDIDRGGVFASLAGTLMLLDEDEKAMVKGLVINKFRGDVSILEPGLRQIEDITGKPVVGVVPYMNLDLEDEDSLSERFTRQDKAAAIDIAVVRLPRISNFTDFNSLECIEGVAVRYIKTVSELRVPDLVILPGTKNTMDDLCSGCVRAGWRRPSSNWPRRERRSLASAAAIRCWDRSCATRWASSMAERSKAWGCCRWSPPSAPRKPAHRSAAAPATLPPPRYRSFPIGPSAGTRFTWGRPNCVVRVVCVNHTNRTKQTIQMRFPSASSSGATGKLARNNRAFAVGMCLAPISTASLTSRRWRRA